MRPKAKTNATGTTSIDHACNMFDQRLGFSKGWAELALKKPPPFVPISLIASWLATGPSEMSCFAPSSVVASTDALQRLRDAERDEDQRDDDGERQVEIERRARQIDPEIADGLGSAARDAPDDRDHDRRRDRRIEEVVRGEAEHLRQMAHRRLAAIGLPVGVGDEADGRVEREIRRDGVEPLRVQGKHVLQPHQGVEEDEAAAGEGQHAKRIGDPSLLDRGVHPREPIKPALDRTPGRATGRCACPRTGRR